MNPLVSIVLATRNYGRFLPMAIESVLSQTFSDWELIIIDDGSQDDTGAILSRYADARLRIQTTDGLGQPRAKNLGIELARGSLIAFLDGDDAWMPTKLQRQIPLFHRPEIGVVYSRRTLMNEGGLDLETPRTPLIRGSIYDQMLVQNCVCFSSCMVRKSVLEAVGLFDPRLPLAIDYDLWLRVARHYEFDYVDEPLVRYRTGHANLSKRLAERIRTVFRIMGRSLFMRGNIHETSLPAVYEAYGMTCRTMAYVQRSQSRWSAAYWYGRAAWFDGKLLQSLRSILGLARPS